MNLDSLAIFDSAMRFGAVITWKGDKYILENLADFDNRDVVEFLLWLETNEPRRYMDKDGLSIIRISKSDPNYHNAVWQEMKIRGFLVYPIEEYQKSILIELNDGSFDKVRQSAMGDILTIPKEKVGDFLETLKEGIKTVNEIKEVS